MFTLVFVSLIIFQPLQILVEDQVATFRLASGSGPVHLSGTHQTETNVIADDDDFGEEGEDDDEDDLDDVEDSPVK